MASAYTRRLIIVIPAAFQASANAAANDVAWDGGGRGDRTFTVALSDSGTAPATHYWCNTALTPALLVGVGNRLRGAGATVAEAAPVPPGGAPASNRFAVFDADDWAAEAVLARLGLQRVATPR